MSWSLETSRPQDAYTSRRGRPTMSRQAVSMWSPDSYVIVYGSSLETTRTVLFVRARLSASVG
eukprot:2010947-Rhodomonas_salina.2